MRSPVAHKFGTRPFGLPKKIYLMTDESKPSTKIKTTTFWMLLTVAMFTCIVARAGETADPAGILKKQIPDKLVVLTFDDGPASHYNVVAPILKQLGFGGSFYVCDFDSFRTRKDWYLTWRQMREMAKDGLEIGNHTSGHVGGAAIGYFLTMEDALIANGVPKPTTIAWPVYDSNPKTYPDLAANGYIFGRGGYKRPYRPTVDNPFDIPGMEPKTVADFVKTVRQAAGGRIVVLTYHGVPDVEHPPVSLAPTIFRAQMQYLKDNHYKVIAMRDLAEYIDPVKAAKLPPTSRDYKPTGKELLASEEKPADKVELLAPPAKMSLITVTKFEEKLSLPGMVIPTNGGTIVLDSDYAVNIPKGTRVELRNELSGPGKVVKTGAGEVRLWNTKNSYSGGTLVHGGTLTVEFNGGALGSGPVTLEDGATFKLDAVNGTNPFTLNGGAFDGTGQWNADVRLNGTVLVSGSLMLNNEKGQISGPGGIIMAGSINQWGNYMWDGIVTLAGNNRYAGPTVARLGTLVLAKAAALYGADTSNWTAENITVHKSATLVLKCGGPGEFTAEQANLLVKRINDIRSTNGLMAGAILCLDTSNAKAPIVLNTDLADAPGPNGGGFDLKKTGDGSLVLAGENTFNGHTHIERGMLSVSSLNSVGKGKATHSSLGAPTDVETGELLLGEGDGTVPKGDGACGLIYTGNGETSDRTMNLAGRDFSVTFEQAGTGLLKLNGPIAISGYGASKQITLGGNTAGAGELAANLFDPYDRAGKAKTSLTKTGTGIWTLSGINTHTGPTAVRQGTLRLATAKSLGPTGDVQITQGAKLDLDFSGEIVIAKLTINGKPQPSGKYSAANCPAITGKGALIVW